MNDSIDSQRAGGPGDDPALASVATWLGGLVALLLVLIALGGFVRLSGSGLSIPEWPIINGSLLPPMTEAGWTTVYEEFVDDQIRLKNLKEAGAVGIGSLGRNPSSMAEFKTMFYIEWSHRAVGALIGLISLACLTVALRNRNVWQRAGTKLVGITGLVIFQGVLGGVLVFSGTSTHFLFLHLGTAAIILSLVVWTAACLLRPQVSAVPKQQLASRSLTDRLLVVAIVATWIQLILGALVAGSRAGSAVVPSWPTMGRVWIPSLWVAEQGLIWNLLDNAILHQWVHRWFAWIVVAVIVAVLIVGRRAVTGIRGRICLHLTMGLVVTQIGLGIFNVWAAGLDIFIALAHLVIGMLLMAVQVIALHDLRHEPLQLDNEQGDALAVPRGGVPA
jgi:cytochrome c oxidase assembly protein subunit 15